MKVFILCFACSVVLWLNRATAQNRPVTITGFVLAAQSGTPLEGATITFQGNGRTVTTNSGGRFRYTIRSSVDSATVTHVGFLPARISLKQGTDTLFIRLVPRPGELEEVIVSNGFQKIPKERATGSFVIVDNATLNRQVGSDILSRLKGVAPGVLFDDSKGKSEKKTLSFNVRGVSTVNGYQDPLIILDNFPYEGNLKNINPNDIDNITILKDAAAASIWGSRAGNGVVVITTKKGKYNQKPLISVNINTGITERPDLSQLNRRISSADYIMVEKLLFDNGYYDYLLTSPTHTAVTPAVELLDKEKNGLITMAERDQGLAALAATDGRKTYRDAFLRNGIDQQYALNIQGGTNRNSYYLSGGYDRGQSVLDERNDRMTLRIENQFRPIDKLQIRISNSFINTLTRSGFKSFDDLNTAAGRTVPYLSYADASGAAIPVTKFRRQSYIDTAGGGRLLDWNYYPLTDDQHNRVDTRRMDWLLNTQVQYELVKGLSLEAQYSIERENQDRRNLSDMQSFNTRDMINRFSQIDPATGMVNYIVPLGSILAQTTTNTLSQNARMQLNGQFHFGEQNIVFLAGAEGRQTTQVSEDRTAFGFDENLYTSGSVDSRNPYPNFVSGYPDYIGGEPRFAKKPIVLFPHSLTLHIHYKKNISCPEVYDGMHPISSEYGPTINGSRSGRRGWPGIFIKKTSIIFPGCLS